VRQSDTPAFIQEWIDTLSPASLAELVPDPSRAAFFSSDLINGFVHFGPLASPRVLGVVEPVVSLFQRGWEYGIRHFVLTQDTHDPETPEFSAYPAHALRGDEESSTIPELASLPFAEHMTIIEKNSLSPAIETTFNDWWDAHPDLNRAIVVGDCTDLCVYQLAMQLRMRANALNLQDFEVIVPVDTVQTFDIPEGGPTGTAHPGDFFHHVFLYHMMSNRIRIVRSISAGDDSGAEGGVTS
jgi:nicotinamidase-related amidase